MSVPFLDLRPVHEPLRAALMAATERVMDSSQYVLGREVEEFEREFAAFCGAANCIGVGNGMEAIELLLHALGIGPGDEVITVSHTAFPTVAAITATGATPVLVDVDPDTFCMQSEALSEGLSPRTRAVVPVHLYGRCADMDPIRELAQEAGVPVIEDAAQAHGAVYRDRSAGTLGLAAAFSFYPTKNLGALGDAGAVVTDDDQLAQRVRRLRNYGESAKWVNVSPGYNSRLDELQAALLRVKLPHVEHWTAQRRAIAARYNELLEGSGVVCPVPDPGHVYHLYVVRCPSRDALREHLHARGIGTQVHYPTPVHRQPAYANGGIRVPSALEATEQLMNEILSLPAYPGLSERDIEEVAEAIRTFEP